MEWFSSLDKTVQVAIITALGGIIAAIITGLFSLINKKNKDTTVKKNSESTRITQTSYGDNNTFIGVQNNSRKED